MRSPHGLEQSADMLGKFGRSTFVEGPTGISITTWVAPAVFFLARIEATICASVSISIGRSTVIRMSSAGASFERAAPRDASADFLDHAIQPLGRESDIGEHRHRVAGAGGLVMAREEVLGILSPSCARIGTRIMVVRLAGTPPMQCLSATIESPKVSCSPVAIIASV